jgi:hypothetical protein
MKDSSHDPDSMIRGSAHWFILEGGLSTSQLDSLLSYISSPKSALTLSNGRTTPLSDTTRFILKVRERIFHHSNSIVLKSSLHVHIPLMLSQII